MNRTQVAKELVKIAADYQDMSKQRKHDERMANKYHESIVDATKAIAKAMVKYVEYTNEKDSKAALKAVMNDLNSYFGK